MCKICTGATMKYSNRMIEAIAMVDGPFDYPANEDVADDFYSAVQVLINEGAWSLPGHYGRTMMNALQGGRCLLGKERSSDAYSAPIPSRDDVVAASAGHFEYVAKRSGREWAEQMAAI
jgi:hypothetical protein